MQSWGLATCTGTGWDVHSTIPVLVRGVFEFVPERKQNRGHTPCDEEHGGDETDSRNAEVGMDDVENQHGAIVGESVRCFVRNGNDRAEWCSGSGNDWDSRRSCSG